MSTTHELVKTEGIAPFAEITKLGHENIVYCYDKETGLKAIIGIHNTM